jgi:uncharacterized OsmC-like protein
MDTIVGAIDRLETKLAERSDYGVGTSRSVTRLGDGLRCATEEGEWSTESDLGEALGGAGSALSPGVLLRAARGSCLAMSYRLRAAKHGIELTSVTVTIEADSAIAGMLLVDADPPPGYSEVRYHVEVESPAAPEDVERIIDEGDRLSPLLDAYARTNTMRRTLSIR